MKLAIQNSQVPDVAKVVALLALPDSERPAGVSAKTSGPLASLVTCIVDRHHAYARSELLRLAALAATVGPLDTALPGVQVVLDSLSALGPELRAHMTKEELVVFPYILSLEAHHVLGRSLVRSPFGVLKRPLLAMLDEQCQTRSLLESMRRASNGYKPPSGASTSIAEVYRGIEALERDLAEHCRLETEILFPCALDLEHRAHI